MSFKGKRVLITGAAGFIGSHLVERLVYEGAAVRALVHYNGMARRGWLDSLPIGKEIEVLAGDICDRDSVRKATASVEIVFHLAALIAIPYSYEAPASYVRSNVEGTLNVLQAAREAGVRRIVHTSTSEVYGTARFVPITEDHPLQGQSPYAASKIGADKIAESFHLSFGLPVVTLRPFNTFGPRQSSRAVIPTIITQCLVGKIVRLGSTSPTRDLNYVSTTVDAFLLAAMAQDAIGRTINVGSGREITIGDVVRIVGRIVGKEIEIVTDEARMRPKNSEVERLLASSGLAQTLLGWSPRVSLEEGLEMTVAWIRENLPSYRPGEYTV